MEREFNHIEEKLVFLLKHKTLINAGIAIINSFENPLLISIHVNIYPSEDCFGAQMFYGTKSPISKQLAD